MNEKNRMLSIGKLSKLTGVHTRSLRYYEELGILVPAYIDQDSKYRYYTFSQLKLVEAIQYCVDLDIPLKQFTEFLEDDQKQINYQKLIALGSRITEQKIARMKNKLAYMKSIQKEMEHGEICRSDQITCCYLPAKTVWLSPYTGILTEKSFHSAAYSIIDEVCENGLKPGYDIGLLSIYQDEMVQQYVYITVAEIDKSQKHPQIFELPAGDYDCIVTSQIKIYDAPMIFPKQFKDKRDKIVVEAELFTGDYRYYEPLCELRCHLME